MVELRVRVDEPDPPAVRATLPGLIEAVRLPDETATVSATVPAKRPRLARVMVEVALEPAVKVMPVGLALILKSGTLTVTVTLWERVPVETVMVTV